MEQSTIDKVINTITDFANNEEKDHIIREKIITRFLDIIETKIIQDEKTHNLEHSCVICWNKKSSFIFIPCGHYCFCSDCVYTLQRIGRHVRCPVCRTIGEYHKVYPTGKINERSNSRVVSTSEEKE